jgi:hypothetical protein
VLPARTGDMRGCWGGIYGAAARIHHGFYKSV